MATVPEKVPREKIRAHTRAMTRVGRVRIRPSTTRSRLTTILLWSMLLEASTATGRAQAQPMTVPKMDILMVSTRGPMTLGKKLQSGWNSFFIKSISLGKRFTMVARLKPVMCSAQAMTSARPRRITGVRLRRRRTVWPLSRVITWGLKILS